MNAAYLTLLESALLILLLCSTIAIFVILDKYNNIKISSLEKEHAMLGDFARELSRHLDDVRRLRMRSEEILAMVGKFEGYDKKC